MTTGEQAELIVNLRLRDQFTAPVKKLQANLQTLDRQTAQLQRGLGKVGQGLKTGLANTAKIAGIGIGFLGLQIKAGIDQLIRFDSIAAQTNAVLKSTKNAAGLTADEIVDMTASLEKLTGIEKETTQEAANLLLTFTNIKDDVFPDTLAVIQDISTAMGSDMNQEAIRLGKALNDPIRGMSALSEVGVTFNDVQRRSIERAQESGNIFKAQTIILKELRKEFGGSAEAADKTFGGSLRRLRNNVADLQVNLAAPLVQPLARLTRRLTEFAASEEVQQGIRDLGEGIAGLFSDENLESGVAAIKSGFGFIRDLPWDTIKSGLQTTADIAGRAVSLFRSLPPELQTGLVTLLAANKLTGGLVAQGIGDVAGFLLRGLTTVNAAVVNVFGTSVNTGVPGVPGAAPAAAAPAAASAVRAVVPFIAAVAGAAAINTVFQGDMTKGNLATRVLVKGAGGEPSSMDIGVGTGMTAYELLQNFNNMIRIAVEGARGGAGIINGQVVSSGTRTGFMTGATPEVTFIGKLNALAAQGEKGNALAQELYTKYSDGVLLAKDGNKLLKDVKVGTAATEKELAKVRHAIAVQEMRVTLQPLINISATATGNSINFAAGGSRLIIPV
jgi:hypothetical protein